MPRLNPADYNLEEKLISLNPVAKVHAGGRTRRWSALVVIGDADAGVVGIGLGKAAEVPDAIGKAADKARKALIKVNRLLSHLPDAGGNSPVLIDTDELLGHQSSRGVLVVTQQVDDIPCLVHVLDVQEDLLFFLFIEIPYDIGSIIRIHMVDELGSNYIRGKDLQETLPVILFQFNKHIRCCLGIKKQKEVLRLFNIEFSVNFCNISRVKILHHLQRGIIIPGLD
mgnify:CR=1 FL=1